MVVKSLADSFECLYPATGTWSSVNENFSFTDNLQAAGFGITTHRGYFVVSNETDWVIDDPSPGQAHKLSYHSLPSGLQTGVVNCVFTRTDNESAWFIADGIDYTQTAYMDSSTPDFSAASNLTSYTLVHDMGGFFPAQHSYTVLSTLNPPPISPGATLLMDFDRDGTIGTNDWNRVDESHPYRFWVNEDGNEAAYPEADMEDFFSTLFMATESNQTFKLSANVNLDYIPTSMTKSNSMEYLHDIDLAQTLAGQIHSLVQGNQTTQTFVEDELILIAPSTLNTNAELYVHILENGSEIAVATNHFSFSSITNMYRIKNLRANGASALDPPSNWPDELTNGKDLVFVHGFNVDEAAARNWHKDIFKRLWHAGSNAKYHGVIWDGAPSSYLGKKHYHHSEINAFATAPALADYLNTLNNPVVLAHSLGNMVVGSAICDHGAIVSQYYALDAAVALEAYGDTTPNTNMVPDSLFASHDTGLFVFAGYRWEAYPSETWASEYYQLFSDVRTNLTWRRRFATLQRKTDAFNFYSSTEDVLRIDDEVGLVDLLVDDFFMKIIPTDFNTTGTYAWQIQEMYKGLDQVPWLNAPGGGVSKYGGWGFVTGDSQHIKPKLYGLLGHRPVRPRTVEEALDLANPNRNTYRASLQSDPLFRHEPEELFQAGAAAFVAGTLGTHGGNLEYHTGDNSLDISAVPIRDWLLAKGFPSRTRPMGSTLNGKWPLTDANFDMSSLYMTDSGKWIRTDKYNGVFEWRHSDFRDVPYVYIYKLYEKITTKEN